MNRENRKLAGVYRKNDKIGNKNNEIILTGSQAVGILGMTMIAGMVGCLFVKKLIK